MAVDSTYNAYQKVGYDEAPDYFAHGSGTGDTDEGKFEVTDSEGEKFKFEVTDDALKVNGKEYYSKTKVESLIATAKSEAKSETETALKAWANSQFQTKTG